MYLSGFGNQHASEATPGALPLEQNSPQNAPLGLYAEQLNGSAFTRPRHLNLHSWLYRKAPSVVLNDFIPYKTSYQKPFSTLQPPNPMRWSPLPEPDIATTFIEGLFHLTGNQHAHGYLYQCSKSMHAQFLTNRDGEFLFIPYQGKLRLRTELGTIDITPGMIAVIPRGIHFAVDVLAGPAQGYLCENSGAPFQLPELGPLGANGLANPRHFMYPKAALDENNSCVEIICKYQQTLWVSTGNHSPLNVVAWHGNYAPYCYDLALFNSINTVSFDHPDPSIFTVLTSPSDTLGIAQFDFVIFPPRWMVAEHTFRPPYFHRNIMSEWMGLITGEYDAKKTGFTPGASSIHNCMTGHGPDYQTYQQASTAVLQPTRYENTLAFMLESREPWLVVEDALNHTTRQVKYTDCWKDLTPSPTR